MPLATHSSDTPAQPFAHPPFETPTHGSSPLGHNRSANGERKTAPRSQTFPATDAINSHPLDIPEISQPWVDSLITRYERWESNCTYTQAKWVGKFTPKTGKNTSQNTRATPSGGIRPPYFSTGTLFPFNPNTAGRKELLRLGFAPRAVDMIEKYRAKGGKFRKKEDFQRLYCVDSLAYSTLENYISLPGQQRPAHAPLYVPPDTLFPFNPNTASRGELLRLGFAPRAVDMIEKYRAKGGKFRKKEDFQRLYCVDSLAYSTLENYISLPGQQRPAHAPLYVPPDTLFPFNPNTASREELLRLGFAPRAVDMIEKYRAKGGKFRRKKDFQRLYCVDSLAYSTLESYITTK